MIKDFPSSGYEINIILGEGHSRKLVEALFDQKVYRTNVSAARGYVEATSRFQMFNQVGKDIVSVVVEEEKKDEVFNYICDFLEVGSKPGILVYMSKLGPSTTYSIPDDLQVHKEEKSEAQA
jgi:nitrogen regulatory protein PII